MEVCVSRCHVPVKICISSRLWALLKIIRCKGTKNRPRFPVLYIVMETKLVLWRISMKEKKNHLFKCNHICLYKETGVQGVPGTFLLLSRCQLWNPQDWCWACCTARGYTWGEIGSFLLKYQCCSFSTSITGKAHGPNHTRDLSQSFLSTFGHIWILRRVAALGLKHSPVFGTRDVLCCCHGLCSCHGLARNYTEDKLLREVESPEEPPVPHASRCRHGLKDWRV